MTKQQIINTIYEKIKDIDTPFGNYGCKIDVENKHGTAKGHAIRRDGWLPRIEKAYNFWERHPEIDGEILDFGCGPGLHLAIGRSLNKDVIGYDIDKNKQAWRHINLELYNPVGFCDNSFDKINFGDNVFDYIYCNASAIKYVEDDKYKDQILIHRAKEFKRILKPDGKLIIEPERHRERFMKYYE